MFTSTAARIELRGKLGELLKSCPIGETISHGDICEVTGMSVEQSRPILYSVMTALNRDHGLVFTSVFGVGYQRLPTAGLPVVGSSARLAITRKSRRAQKTITNALGRANDVDPALRKRLHSEVGVLGLVELAASERSFKMIAAETNSAAVTPPSPADIAETMMEKLGMKR